MFFSYPNLFASGVGVVLRTLFYCSVLVTSMLLGMPTCQYAMQSKDLWFTQQSEEVQQFFANNPIADDITIMCQDDKKLRITREELALLCSKSNVIFDQLVDCQGDVQSSIVYCPHLKKNSVLEILHLFEKKDRYYRAFEFAQLLKSADYLAINLDDAVKKEFVKRFSNNNLPLFFTTNYADLEKIEHEITEYKCEIITALLGQEPELISSIFKDVSVYRSNNIEHIADKFYLHDNLLALVTPENCISIYHVTKDCLTCVANIYPDGATIKTIALCDDKLAVGIDDQVQIFDVKTGNAVANINRINPHILQFSKNNTQVLIAADNNIIIADVATGKQLLHFDVKQPVSVFDIDESKQKIAVGYNGKLKLIDLVSGDTSVVIDAGYPLLAIKFMPDKLLAITHGGNKIYINYIDCNGELHEVRCLPINQFFKNSCISLKKNMLVIGGLRGSVEVFDLSTGANLMRWNNDRKMPYEVALNSNGLMAALQQGKLELFDVSAIANKWQDVYAMTFEQVLVFLLKYYSADHKLCKETMQHENVARILQTIKKSPRISAMYTSCFGKIKNTGMKTRVKKIIKTGIVQN